jgi:hypothetical protein
MKNNCIVLTDEYQAKWANNQFFDVSILNNIDPKAKLHTELNHVRSSAASCINVLGNLGKTENTNDLIIFLNHYGLNVEEIIPFPSGEDVGGKRYDDKGNVVFEWVGPLKSPINELGGNRGINRTSIDAYILAKIERKITQLLIEWKFTETYPSKTFTHRFGGLKGNERLRRYSNVLAKLRKKKDFPFYMHDEDTFGLSDLGYEPFYQLLRMTLLAKSTTPMQLTSNISIQDYRVIHLSHSQNVELNYLSEKHLFFSPGLRHLAGKTLHESWKSILTDSEHNKFFGGYWDEAIQTISDTPLKEYLIKRYCYIPAKNSTAAE